MAFRMMMPSEPTQPVAAAAMAMDWGEMTLPTVAPAALAATSHSWLSPSAEAVCACRALNRVQEEVTLPVVMYHRVCEQEDADRYTVSAAGLEKDLEALLAAGYTPVRLSQVLDYARSGGHAGHHDQRGVLQHAHPLAGVPLPFGAL